MLYEIREKRTENTLRWAEVCSDCDEYRLHLHTYATTIHNEPRKLIFERHYTLPKSYTEKQVKAMFSEFLNKGWLPKEAEILGAWLETK